jgi:DNA-binding winged helix-turn-helix (wHTH) protein
MDSATKLPTRVTFGCFEVLPHRRELLADGKPVKLGGRTFDVLMALIEGRGAVLSRNALMTRVWPDRIVEENNLQVHISDLRAILGADRKLVRTVFGRGYQFTGEVRVLPEGRDERAGASVTVTPPAAMKPTAAPPRTNLPEPVSELIGRDRELNEILGLVAAPRLVTLTGAGGIGKTRLAPGGCAPIAAEIFRRGLARRAGAAR